MVDLSDVACLQVLGLTMKACSSLLYCYIIVVQRLMNINMLLFVSQTALASKYIMSVMLVDVNNNFVHYF